MAIRFKEEDVRPMGRQARGVRAMTLAEDDYAVAVVIVGEEDLMLSILVMDSVNGPIFLSTG